MVSLGHVAVVAHVRHRAAQLGVLAALGFVVAAAVVGPVAVRDSAAVAGSESSRAELGQRTFALQTSDAQVIDQLARMPEAAPVQDDMGEVRTDASSARVAVRSTTDPLLELGILSGGERPGEAGELAISAEVASALDVAIGDTVSVLVNDEASAGRVVGLLSDPADAADATVVRVVDRTPSFRPATWLSNADFYASPELQPALDRRAATYQPVEWLLLGTEANAPQWIGALEYVPAGAGIVGAILVVAAAVALAPTWRSDVGTLVAAGTVPRDAWRRVLWTGFGSVLLGVIAGSGAVLAGLRLARTEVSARLGQNWDHVSVPWSEMILVVGAVVLAGAVSVPLARYLPLFWSWCARRSGVGSGAGRRWLLPVVGVVAVAGLLMWVIALRAGLEAVDSPAMRLAPIGAAMVVLSAPLLFGALLWRVLPGAARAESSRPVLAVSMTGAVAAVVILATATWSAQTTRDANANEAGSPLPVPDGTFVISSMPDSAIPVLRELYGNLGGRDVDTFGIPDSTEGNLRVSSPDALDCLADSGASTIIDIPERCFDSAVAAPINTVLLGPAGSDHLAEEGLVADETVGLIWFSRESGKIGRTASTEAQPGVDLGGNLPGLVVPADGSVAKQFDLRPSGMSEVVLADFYQLPPEDRYALHAGVLRLAPGAEVADATSRTEYDRARTQADAVSVVGAASAAAVVLLGGGLAVLAQRLTRKTLPDVRLFPARRTSIALCWSLVPIFSAALALALAFLTVSVGGRVVDISFGELWYLPGAAGIVAGCLLWFISNRVSERGRR